MAGHGTPDHVYFVEWARYSFEGAPVQAALAVNTFACRPYIPCGTSTVGRFGRVRIETLIVGSLA